MTKKAIIMDENAIKRAITRISYEILERNHGANDICIIGIVSRGNIIAQRIANKIQEVEHITVPCGSLDITAYRDDRNSTATPKGESNIDFDVQGKHVIIVDDVLYTGRSCRAAIDAILAIGRPKNMQLAVLVDRGHRELPIRPDYVGKNVPTSHHETVKVQIRELDDIDSVAIYSDEESEA